jgi:hypothetical protein
VYVLDFRAEDFTHTKNARLFAKLGPEDVRQEHSPGCAGTPTHSDAAGWLHNRTALAQIASDGKESSDGWHGIG